MSEQAKLGTSVAMISSAPVESKSPLAWTYDFTVHGGAIKDYTTSIVVPPYKTIILAYCKVAPAGALTSGGSATIALKLNSANDLYSAATYSGFTNGVTVAGVPVNTLGTAVSNATAVGIPVVMSIAGAAVTAGSFTVYSYLVD